jgi:predicted sulfurtransferase
MIRFMLRAIDKEDGTVTTKSFECDYLGEVVDKTADFYRGIGFVFDELVAVNDDDSNSNDSPIQFLTEKKESVYSQYRHSD